MKIYRFLVSAVLCCALLFGCAGEDGESSVPAPGMEEVSEQESAAGEASDPETASDAEEDEDEKPEEAASPSAEGSTGTASSSPSQRKAKKSEKTASFDLASVPDYSGTPYVEVNGNRPYFSKSDLNRASEPFEEYASLDGEGRCGTAFACVADELMPTEKRGAIGHIRPSGWHTVKYDFLPDRYLYNRCHLIAFMLAGENDNERNLITGTRYMNVDGMLDFEDQVADYVHDTDDDVLYRVTPCFEGDDLVAKGVLMEAQSVDRDALSFCVFCYNVQPGVEIDYEDGDSKAMKDAASYYGDSGSESQRKETAKTAKQSAKAGGEESGTEKEIPKGTTYVLNTNTMKFHLPDCGSVKTMSSKNTQTFSGSRQEAIESGYEPCGRCHP